MRILLTGQTSLHWGRMEFGNIGNYYIIEPFIRELHRVFDNAEIVTTLQMSDDFCQKEKVKVLPMEMYYGWIEEDLPTALKEYSIADIYNKTNILIDRTPYIDEVIKSDLVIDFSGDIWGDNADFLGENRLLVGLLKNRVAQLLRKPTAMLAGSPGPFNNKKLLPFVKEVYENFDLITNRDPISTELLKQNGFKSDNVQTLPCPSFLFEPLKGKAKETLLKKEKLTNKEKPIAGFIICGWNFKKGPFDKWPRKDEEYEVFAEAVEYMINELDLKVCLMSHSNGFPIPPAEFELLHGRDYPVIKQFQKILYERGNVSKENVFALDGVYNTWETKAILGSFDMLVSGRVHAAVGALSQNVPTVIIDYGHEPKAHKLRGFAKIAGVEEYVANPTSSKDLIQKIKKCWKNKEDINKHLINQNFFIKKEAQKNFDLLKTIL